ncbi:hypothetical protein A2765_05740 [Candidatus Kaiserbacteria bacterium RIFCSPHIGHO2_01_FULL_56_24]|uniref:Uncharacterized protein n=1 Tax=Candidatus Kaiserbacteria bacterium RIFCSPHIGHO2_01_FULL_56_24 TaxID=1798487 RepID=A0A1F6DAM8_9BACT|nr:MAG: hypothetical protein A2765_05740 [Candidatus Kaiserbacteria bacterium RIFCSPHIGHO2_01_FULL_56_24]
MVNLDKLRQRAKSNPESVPAHTTDERTKLIAEANTLDEALREAVNQREKAIEERIEAAKAGGTPDMAREEELSRKVADLQKRFDAARAAIAQSPTSGPKHGTNAMSPEPDSKRSQGKIQKIQLGTVLKSLNTLDSAMRNTADKARFGKELVEACARLKDKIDAQVVTLMNMMNRALDIGTDGRAYDHDTSSDTIVAIATNPDLISSFRATEEVTRELEAVVREMPVEIEKLFHVLDESHAEFISIITGEKHEPQKRVFDPMPSIDPGPGHVAPARTPKSIEASLQAALGESANRAVFLQELVEASKRLKEQIDARVVTLLSMMNNALTKGVDDIAYTFDGPNNRMMPVPQSDLVTGFTTTENVARELEEAVVDMPREIQALITELLNADEEFNTLIAQGLARSNR